MAVYRRPSRTRNVLAVLVLAALTLVTIDARSSGSGVLGDVRSKVSDVFNPLESAIHAVLRPVGNFFTGVVDYGSVNHENQQLRRQLAQAATSEAQAQAATAQAEQVLKLENLPFVGGIPTVVAQITDIGPSNFDNTVTIGKGTDSGLADGQPVVAAGGLVGTVQHTSAHTATVELLTDPNFDVGVILHGANVGSAEGAGRTLPLRVTVDTTNNPPPVEKVGAAVVTSGLAGEKFPSGIPVGKVSRVSKVPGAIEPEIDITPYVNASALGYVEILLWSPQ